MTAVVESSRNQPSTDRLVGVRKALWAVLGLMILQGVLGIYVNLFSSLPVPSDPNAVFPIVFSTPVLAAHFLNALALIGLSAYLVWSAGRVRVPGLRFWSAMLLVAFFAATYSGYHFTGTQNNDYSFAMELGFLAALGVVALLIYRVGVSLVVERGVSAVTG